MSIYIEDPELLFLITSGKSRKYRKLPNEKNLVKQLRYLFNIVSVLSDMSELALYKSIYTTIIPAGDESFLLPICGKSGMALKVQCSDNAATFLALQNITNYEQGR